MRLSNDAEALGVRRKWALAGLALAIPLGLALGCLSSEVRRTALESSRLWLALALDILIDGIAPMGTAALAVTILRSVEPRKLWLAAALLVLPVIATHYAAVYHPLVVLLAEASWFLVVITCARAKRTWAVWCVVACAACTTGIQLESSARGGRHEHGLRRDSDYTRSAVE